MMPPPMRELNTGYPPMESRYVAPPPGGGGGNGYGYGGPGIDEYGYEEDPNRPGRGQRLLQRMASEPGRYATGGGRHSLNSPSGSKRSYTLQYPSRNSGYTRGSGSVHGHPHSSRNYGSGLDYASDTEALQSPVVSMRMSRATGRSVGPNGVAVSSRSSSLPRTFQREALLRHPELSMEMDRLMPDPGALSGLSTDDQLSDSGAISAPESVITARKRGETVFLVCVSWFRGINKVKSLSVLLVLSCLIGTCTFSFNTNVAFTAAHN